MKIKSIFIFVIIIFIKKRSKNRVHNAVEVVEEAHKLRSLTHILCCCRHHHRCSHFVCLVVMAATLTPIQTLKFPSLQPKPLFSLKLPSFFTPHTFTAHNLTVSAATSSNTTVSASTPPSPPSPARSKHVFLFRFLLFTFLLRLASFPIRC